MILCLNFTNTVKVSCFGELGVTFALLMGKGRVEELTLTAFCGVINEGGEGSYLISDLTDMEL
jgi:hypothetical protein